MGKIKELADCCQSNLIKVRWMITRDMPAVQRIENESFYNPWREIDFIRCLRQRACIGVVAECDDVVVGFMVYEMHSKRLRVVNFAVSVISIRQGIGREMIQWLQRRLLPDLRNRIVLEVRETNLDAQLFFKAMGFRAISVLRDRCDDNDEDTYLMQYRLNAVVMPVVMPVAKTSETPKRTSRIGRQRGH